MLTHPDTVRPDLTSAALYLDKVLGDEAVATAMSVVIIRQAQRSFSTCVADFLAAPETRHFTLTQLQQNLGRASELADVTVIRQDAIDYQPPAEAGQVFGYREGPADADPDDLVVNALPLAMQILAGNALVDALYPAGFTPAQIRAIWPKLTVAMAERIVAMPRPSIVEIAMRIRERTAA